MAENVAREFTEKSGERIKDSHGKAQAVFDETAKVMERTYFTGTKGAADLNLHLLETAQENMNAAFDFARQLTSVKSPSEFFELWAAHMRKQFETFSEQAKHLTAVAQKATTDAAQPFQAEVAKTFRKSA